jgi:hypothetical protein
MIIRFIEYLTIIMFKKAKKFLLATILSSVIFCSTAIPQQSFARWFGDMIGVDWIHTIWTQRKQGDSLLYTIQTAINWVLWILATISLCLVLYAWFLMLTSWWDSKKYDTGLKIIKNAAIWLAIIAVSRLIVSLIFYVINWSVNPNIDQTE